MFIIYPNGDMVNTAHVKKIYASDKWEYDEVLGDHVRVEPKSVTIEYISHKQFRDTDELDLEWMSELMGYKIEHVNEFLGFLYNELKGEEI